jgi:hypothetical protein
MAEEECELNEKQKREIAKWFLLNSPAGEIQYIAKGRSVGHICDFFLLFLLHFVFIIDQFWIWQI